MKTKARNLTIALGVTIVCLLGLPQKGSAFLPPLSPKEDRQEIAFREAGLHGDHSLIPAMIQVLHENQHPYIRKTILHALAQLGALEALPEINAIAKMSSSYDTDKVAQAARIRLLAESSGAGISDPKAQAEAKVKRFFQELGKPPASLTEPFKADPYRIYGTVEGDEIEELTDMVYQAGSQNYSVWASLPEIKQVDFSMDDYASLKMKMAALPPAQQRTWLIDKLVHSEAGLGETIQLLLNLGRDAAAQAAAKKLMEIDGDRVNYKAADFMNLFRLLNAVRESDQTVVRERFHTDLDRGIAGYSYLPSLGSLSATEEYEFGY